MGPEIYIKDNCIEIGKLIKKIGLVSTGGQVKYFLETNKILINNNKPAGRSTKVYIDDVVWINNEIYMIKQHEK
ncbi:RNA-binding S4 domain-containing protein [Mycoplasmopsis felifaucium]|uniref:RNA-binding S4 domain-containing protein n=1 Tax=Mycoplasmopsis felifaucium TaxID=35768 RepID=A0ABZ2RSF5_9BACT